MRSHCLPFFKNQYCHQNLHPHQQHHLHKHHYYQIHLKILKVTFTWIMTTDSKPPGFNVSSRFVKMVITAMCDFYYYLICFTDKAFLAVVIVITTIILVIVSPSQGKSLRNRIESAWDTDSSELGLSSEALSRRPKFVAGDPVSDSLRSEVEMNLRGLQHGAAVLLTKHVRTTTPVFTTITHVHYTPGMTLFNFKRSLSTVSPIFPNTTHIHYTLRVTCFNFKRS